MVREARRGEVVVRWVARVLRWVERRVRREVREGLACEGFCQVLFFFNSLLFFGVGVG